jgi:uncharacterized protein
MDYFQLFTSRFLHTYTYNILVDAWQLLSELWLYLLIGIVLTALFQAFLDKQKLSNWIKNHTQLSLLGAAAFGVISPLGTYVCLPMAGSLHRNGTPLAPLMAFIIASPILNPTIFMLTIGAFSYEMAFIRLISGILLGVTGGYVFLYLDKKHKLNFTDSEQVSNIKPNQTQRSVLQKFLRELKGSALYMLKYFSIAIIIAAIIKNIITPNQVEWILGNGSFLSVLFATGAGIPLYSCGGAAIPVLYQLSELGMTKGAILAFFISGPSTRISNLVIMKSVFSLKLVVYYLLIVLSGALILGYFYNLIP